MIFKISLIRDFFVMLLSDLAHDTPVDLHLEKCSCTHRYQFSDRECPPYQIDIAGLC